MSIFIFKLIANILIICIIGYFACKDGYNRGRRARKEFDRTGEISDNLVNNMFVNVENSEPKEKK